MTSTPLLDVTDLRLSYATEAGELPAVDGISFSIQEGEALGLVGESGAGKSSVALTLLRLWPRNGRLVSGQMKLSGNNLFALSDDAFRRQVRWQQIAMVFQGASESLNPVLRVGTQIMEPLRVHRGASKQEAIQEARRALSLVYLPPEILDRYPHELSGGMKQRAVIAMALVLQPKVLILDEPTSALDVTTQAQIMDQLKDLKEQLNLGIIFITHDIALASDICDTIGVMYAGKMAEMGPAEAVLNTPQHPYAQLLLASVARIQQEEQPVSIPGVPPNLASLPSGCRFHPRCPKAFDRCSTELPNLIASPTGSLGACWLLEEKS
ncbi:MAG: peptide/nickel transport system ATP-binding protein [Chloroflexi bacterium]|jgi:peptide/nickel transport system ATP-binding protein|nr:MAG: peptide/nickel transport system ATP-binding protein [Chloroflexota bacterium]